MHLVLGAGCAALVLLASGAVVRAPAASASPQLVELEPSASCDAAVDPSWRRRHHGCGEPAALSARERCGRAGAAPAPGLRRAPLHAPDSVAGTMSVTDFTDPLVGTEWWRAAIGVAGLTPPGPGKPITIVDSGVDVAHPEFAGRSSIVTLNAQEPAPLGGVHGTAVASLIGAPANDVGTVGIYPEALLQTWDAALGAGTALQTSDIVAGVLAAANQGPGVINLSLGAERSFLPIQQAIETAIRKGMLVVAAAGNDGDIGSPLSFPASLPHVLTAAATDQQNRVDVVLEPVPLRRYRGAGTGHHCGDGARRQLGARGGHELLLAARRGCSGVGLDGAARARRESAVRGDAPLRRRHRRAGQGRRTGLRPPQRPRRARLRGAGARSARAERRHRLRGAGQDVRQRHPAADDEGEAVDHAHRPADDRGGPA